MKQRPILFSTEMVRAILDGRKTQTRRAVKPQPDLLYGCSFIEFDSSFGWVVKHQIGANPNKYEITSSHKCPYGAVGDVLWVRETWQHTSCLNLNSEDENYGFVYKANGEPWEDYEGWKWRPSIFMPREACRLLLKITNIRVERLGDISEEDAAAEGIQEFTKDRVGFKYGLDGWHWSSQTGTPFMCKNRRVAFGELWQSINGTESLKSNPFVWVIEFTKIEKSEIPIDGSKVQTHIRLSRFQKSPVHFNEYDVSNTEPWKKSAFKDYFDKEGELPN